MEEKLANFKLDLEEINQLMQSVKRPNTKLLLLNHAKSLANSISELERKLTSKAVKPEGQEEPSVKRYVAELKTYAWDQSDKFVKIFVTLDGLSPDRGDARVDCQFGENSLNLLIVNGTKDRDYSFMVKNLLEPINVAKSYAKIKTDMVAIYMKKEVEGKNWSHLTSTEKHLKEMKDSGFKDDLESTSDPSAGLMNMMKRLYEQGDSETKKMIAKSWQESEEKRLRGET
ncbi:calcyclin-binding protein [Culicoides brevitarsis]|uniref:calcyclin-binding protein n=1 Tax=Culicoides brevitarsis TaxID=469753 RepID=UPI00307CB7F7